MLTRNKNITKVGNRKEKIRKLLPWLFIGIICAVFLVGYKSFFDPKLDSNGDNINYFLLAKSLAEGNGYKDIIPPVSVPHTHFPPGYPMFMSVFMHLFPDNIIAMKILNGVLFLIAVLMLFRIVRKVTDDNIWLAFAVCLVTVYHPTIMRWSVIMMSEMLYIVISFGIVLLCLDLDVGRIFAKKGNRDRWQIARFVLLCILVISSYLVRTMGISVVLSASLAFGITAIKYLLAKDKRWKAPIVTAIIILVTLFVTHEGWSVRNHQVAPGRGNDYSSGFLYTSNHERMTSSLWMSRIKKNASEYITSWIPSSILNPSETYDHQKHRKPTPKGWCIGAVVILLMAFGGYRMKRGRTLVLSYILITFVVLLLYQEQYAGVRYFVPVLPLMFFLFLNGLWELVVWIQDKTCQKKGIMMPLASLVVVGAVFCYTYKEGRRIYIKTASYETYVEMDPKSPFAHYIQAAEWLKTHAGKDAIIACRKPEIMFMYSGYRHSVRFPINGDDEEILRALDKSNANWIVLDTWAKHAYSVIYPVLKNHQDEFPVYYVTKQDNERAPTAVLAILHGKSIINKQQN